MAALTHSVVVQVLGKAKGVIAVVLSLLIFRNRVKPLGMAGYSLCVAGVFCYSEAKRRGGRNTQGHARQQQQLVMPVDAAGGGLLPLSISSPVRPIRPSEDLSLPAEVSLHVRHHHLHSAKGGAGDDAKTW